MNFGIYTANLISSHLKKTRLYLLVFLLVSFSQSNLANEIDKNNQETSNKKFYELIEKVRNKALSYTDSLPNFICRQTTKRYVHTLGRGRGWLQTNSYLAELSFYNKIEQYKLLSINGQPTSKVPKDKKDRQGSTGEFGSALKGLFDPSTSGTFYPEGSEKINNIKTLRIRFHVAKKTSKRFISYNRHTIITGYRGQCWIHPQNYQVVRLKKEAIDIPKPFPVRRFNMTLDYALTKIEQDKHWLPKKAEVWLSHRIASGISRQVNTRTSIQFRSYRKFSTGVKIVTD